MANSIEIIDCTLRDGEQAAGIAFSAREKLEIAVMLDKAGVKLIEAGTPAMGVEEQDAMRRILSAGLNACVFAWNRACEQDIAASVACGFTMVHISIPVSDLHIRTKLRQSRAWALEQLAKSVDFAKNLGCTVSVGAEDASRATLEQFLELAELAAHLGAVRIRYADTIGCLEPFRTREIISKITLRSPLPVEFHGHNDFGLALANSLAAWQAGAGFVSVTSAGIGERAGNTALEEFTAAARGIYKQDTGINLAAAERLGETVAEICRRPVFPYKPVLGSKNRLSECYRRSPRPDPLAIQPVLDRMMR